MLPACSWMAPCTTRRPVAVSPIRVRRPPAPLSVRATNPRFSMRVSWCDTRLFSQSSDSARSPTRSSRPGACHSVTSTLNSAFEMPHARCRPRSSSRTSRRCARIQVSHSSHSSGSMARIVPGERQLTHQLPRPTVDVSTLGKDIMRTLLRGGIVVSMDPVIGDLSRGDVLIEDGRIAAVAVTIDAAGAEVVDAAGKIVLPGFIDTHRHTWQTPVRGVLPCCTLDAYFGDMLGKIGLNYRPEDVYIGNYAGALEALNAGITTLLDWSHISNTPEHSDEAVHGLKDSGIRGVYANGIQGDNSWWAYSDRGHTDDIRRIRVQYFSSDDQLLTLAMAARSVGNVTPETAQHDWGLARELGIRVTVHVGMRLTGIHVHHILGMH